MNYPKISEIINVKKENPIVKTLIFKYNKKTIPGQFFMIWIPGLDEIPMSASFINENKKGITFKKVGEATETLFNFNKGDKIGIRGPYGNGFSIIGKRALFIGGGSGIATITPAIEEYLKRKINTTVILGIKNKNELFFENRIKKYNVKVHVTSEDGSYGYTGLATDLAEDLIANNDYDSVLTCGPEKMMKKIFDICKNISFLPFSTIFK